MIKKIVVLFTVCTYLLTACSVKTTKSANANANMEFGHQNGKSLYWHIVGDDGDHYILLSEKVLDVKNYDDKENVSEFTGSTLYEYLNSDFINSTFSNDERDKLVFISGEGSALVTLPSTNNLLDLYGSMNYVKDGYYNSKDYFAANDKIIAKPTDLAIYNEIDPFDNEVFAEILQTDVDTRYNFANGNVPYWLLNVDKETGYPLYVTPTGYVGKTEANTGYIGIRPMIRIKK